MVLLQNMNPVKNLVRKRREARVRHLNSVIARRSILIEGSDPEMWPEDVAIAQEERKRASFERVDLLHKLSKEN